MSKFFKIHVEKGGKPRLRMHGKASFFWHIVAMFLFLLLSALNMLRCVLHFCDKLTAAASLLTSRRVDSFPVAGMRLYFDTSDQMIPRTQDALRNGF